MLIEITLQYSSNTISPSPCGRSVWSYGGWPPLLLGVEGIYAAHVSGSSVICAGSPGQWGAFWCAGIGTAPGEGKYKFF